MWIESLEELEALYGAPGQTSLVKVADRITPEYRALIEASPFLTLATAGPEGLDCSPRGDFGAVVTVVDEKTLHLPDRRGNNRVDTLRNIIRDPRVALLFLIPGSGTTVRVNGRARLTADPVLLDHYSVEGKKPRSVMAIEVEEVYFQCARAIVRSALWDAESRVDPKSVPSPGAILQAQTRAAADGDAIDGARYDSEWTERAKKTLW